MAAKKEYSYKECKEIVDEKLQVLKAKREMKLFCQQHNLSYNTLVMFKNNKLVQTVAERFMVQILQAFDYKVNVKTVTTYKLDKELE